MVTVDDAVRLTVSALGSILNPGKTKKKLPKIESGKYPEIYVFRHGETYDNRNRVFSGRRDTRLTPRGEKQARILRQKLKSKKIDICIHSSLQRSRKTALIALRGKGVKFEVDDRIIERDYGELSGTSKAKMTREDPLEAVKYRRFFDYPPPRGEREKKVRERVFQFCGELVKRVRKDGVNVAISCHGNSMKMVRLYFEKMPLVEALVQENPLGTDYAQYVVTEKKVMVAKTAGD